jgi:hypothetical protein
MISKQAINTIQSSRSMISFTDNILATTMKMLKELGLLHQSPRCPVLGQTPGRGAPFSLMSDPERFHYRDLGDD